MKIHGTNPISFFDSIKEPSFLKKTALLIGSIAAAALAYFIAGWVGIAICTAILTATYLCARSPSETTPVSSTKVVDPQGLSIPFTNTNKSYAYRLLTAESGLLETEINLEKVHAPANLDQKWLPKSDLKFTLQTGPFSYPDGPHHWTANFGDQNVFFGSISGLLAQDELQALEHPALSHVYMRIKDDPTFGKLDQEGSALLVQGAKRYGLLRNLYGNAFAQAPRATIEQNLEIFREPRESKLFVFVAPHIPPHLEGQPYQYHHLHTLFHNAYAAFKGILAKDPDAIIHTGNWGCGAFGNDPKTAAVIQLAAARLAGAKRVCYYPLASGNILDPAEQLLDQIPEMTVDNFLRHLETHAAEYGLLYRHGNGT